MIYLLLLTASFHYNVIAPCRRAVILILTTFAYIKRCESLKI